MEALIQAGGESIQSWPDREALDTRLLRL